MLQHLDLFSGLGGFALAASRTRQIKTCQFVEINPYCQEVLRKNFQGIPTHSDIQTFHPTKDYDLVTAGFPCQDISGANPFGKGLSGKRSGLFFEAMRVIRECSPRYVVLENVSALLRKHQGRDMALIFQELSQAGLDAEWRVVSAYQVGALHQRERLFILAYPRGFRRDNGWTSDFQYEVQDDPQWNSAKSVRDWEGWKSWLQSLHPISNWFDSPTGVVRESDGTSGRMDRYRRQERIKAIGNAVYPEAAIQPLKRILEMESQEGA